ncbi:MAG: YraN family protein [Pseudomonadota bacterium]
MSAQFPLLRGARWPARLQVPAGGAAEEAPRRHGGIRRSKRIAYGAGLLAELLCIAYLACRGYRIHAWRAQTGAGEMDIVASRREHWVFVEVKQRSEGTTAALSALRDDQCARLRRAAGAFMKQHTRSARLGFAREMSCRFDYVALNGWFRPIHISDAF